jgi:DNA-binding NtrC family response regulator
MEPKTVRSLRQLLEPKDELPARAIVLGPSVLKDLHLSELVPRLRDQWPMVDVVLWTARASGTLVREALNAGAKDVLMTSSADTCARDVVSIVESQQLLPRAARLGDERNERSEFEGMYSRSRRMWDLFDTATQVAATEATVLILGETGTGKELLARAIHRHSGRTGKFVPINCGAVNESLVDSELFGHVKGAFTGATDAKAGLFKHAQAGTLFLDEVGNVPLTAQYHLLRALQEGAVRPVGGHDEQNVDVRVIAATSNPLESDVRRGRFREDLFYRLDVIRLEVPPLRERPEDIVFLFAHFARKLAEDYNVERPDLRDDFLDALISYEWPGNVRQLENFSERLVLTCTGQRIGADVFRRLISLKKQTPPRENSELPRVVRVPGLRLVDGIIDTSKTLSDVLDPQIASVERSYLEQALRECEGRIGVTAERAGISRRTLLRKMKLHGLDKTSFRQDGETPAST